MKTILMRIPIADGREIEAIARKLQIPRTSAFQIWKRKTKPEITWKEI